MLATPVAHGAVFVDWIPTSDTTLSLLRLVRSVVGYPVSPTDGEVLVDSPSVLSTIGYNDTDVHGGVRYYYGVFVFSSTLQTWLAAGTTTALATADIDTGRRMFQLIPTMYRQADTNSLLSRFMTLFGYQFDILRTEAASISTITDPQAGHALGVAYALDMFGLLPEPELGFAAQRQLLAVASTLFITKGTALCARLLATALTGWAAAVFPGGNLLLDDLDSSGNGAAGRWAATTGQINYRAGDGTINAPFGAGMLDITNTAGGTTSTSFVTTTGVPALLQGVPVVGGSNYDAGAIFRWGPSGTGVNTTLHIDWYDASGNFLSSADGTAVVPLLGNWNVSTTISNVTAPSNASRAALRITTASLTSTQHVYAAELYLCQHGNLSNGWEPARLTKITLGADHVNEIANPRFASNTANWNVSALGPSLSGATLVRVAGTDGPPPTPATYATITATAALQGAWIKTVYALQGDSLITGTIWARTSIGGSVYVVSDDGTLAPVHLPLSADGAWHEYHVPFVTGETFTNVNLLVVTANSGTIDIGGAMVNMGDPVEFFDGAFTSATADYIWESTANASRSHYYIDRSVKAARLRAVLPQFLPPALQYVLLFAQAPSLSPGAYGVGPYGSGAYGIGGF